MSAADQAQKLGAKPVAGVAKSAGARPVPSKGAQGGQQRVSALGIVLMLGVGACVLGLSPPSFMVLITGMAPTVISYFFETGTARRALPCMVALNIAGVAPALNMLWSRGSTISGAYALLRDPYIWLLMYGSAAAAFALIWAMPRLAQAVIDASARSRRQQLVAEQDKLVAEWGDEVAHGVASKPTRPKPRERAAAPSTAA